MALDTYKISDTDVNAVAIHVVITGDRLTGTVLENKETFDAYPDMIATKFNALIDHLDDVSPDGDDGLNYSASEISTITSILGCTEADITL